MLKIKVVDAYNENNVLFEENDEAFIDSVVKKAEKKNNGIAIEQAAVCLGNASPRTINLVLDAMSSQIKEQVNAKVYAETEKLMKDLGVPEDKIRESARKFVEHMDNVGSTTVSEKDTPPRQICWNISLKECWG